MRTQTRPQTEFSTDWHVNNAPAANTKATISKAAVSQSPSGSVCNVLEALCVTIVGGASAPTAIALSVAVIDGDSGGTNYLFGPMAIAVPNVAGAVNGIALSGLNVRGTPNTAMTIEFSAAGGANTIESVWMAGSTSQ